MSVKVAYLTPIPSSITILMPLPVILNVLMVNTLMMLINVRIVYHLVHHALIRKIVQAVSLIHGYMSKIVCLSVLIPTIMMIRVCVWNANLHVDSVKAYQNAVHV
jgi:hypothetical protein